MCHSKARTSPLIIGKWCCLNLYILSDPFYVHRQTKLHMKDFSHLERIWYGDLTTNLAHHSWNCVDEKSVRQSKYDPLVEEVMLLESNPQYALIRHEDGRESTVNIRQLAPPGEDCTIRDSSASQPLEISHHNSAQVSSRRECARMRNQ